MCVVFGVQTARCSAHNSRGFSETYLGRGLSASRYALELDFSVLGRGQLFALHDLRPFRWHQHRQVRVPGPDARLTVFAGAYLALELGVVLQLNLLDGQTEITCAENTSISRRPVISPLSKTRATL